LAPSETGSGNQLKPFSPTDCFASATIVEYDTFLRIMTTIPRQNVSRA